MKDRACAAVLMAVFAAAACACDSSRTRTYVAGPSATTALTATFVQSPATLAGATFLGYLGQPCGIASPRSSTFALVLAASRLSRLSRVSIQLNDGSHLGGPAITFPQPGTDIGTLRIAAGETRMFTFQPRFGCGAVLPAWVGASIDWMDVTGAMQTITATTALQ